jgi:hypothetical protein
LIIDVLEVLSAWMPVAAEVASGIAGMTAEVFAFLPSLEATQSTITSVTAGVKTFFAEFRNIVQLALLTSAAEVVEYVTDLVYQFTEVLPWALKSMWSIAEDVFSQFDDLISQVVENSIANLGMLWDAVMAALRGEDFEFPALKTLTDFEIKLKELPKLAKKEMSQLEKDLRAEAGLIAADIALTYESERSKLEGAAKNKEAAKRLEGGDDSAVDLSKNNTGLDTGSEASTGGTESLLAMTQRIQEAAAGVTVQDAVHTVADNVATTNEILTDMKDAESNIVVNVDQDKVVQAHNTNTEKIVNALKGLNMKATFA